MKRTAATTTLPHVRTRMSGFGAALLLAGLVGLPACDAASVDAGAMKAPAAATLRVATAMPVGARSGAGALVPPAGFVAAVGEGKARKRPCPAADARPYTETLEFASKYEGSDKARDDLNTESEKRYRTKTAPITAFEKGVSQQVDEYMRSGSPEALSCALGLLQQWAGAKALLGEASNHTGKSVRKWALGSVASSYVRLKFSTSQPLADKPELSRSVESWMSNVADRVVKEWKDLPLEKVNNHEYWAAWAVMAVAVATDRRDLFDWSLKQFDVAMTQIDVDGYLPNELKRDTRALSYHNYSLPPLTMIAAFAKANGVELRPEARAALERLTGRVMSGVADPHEFEEKTGKKQVVADLAQAGKFTWMEPYCWTVRCTSQMQERRDAMRPFKNYRLGGNLTDLFNPVAGKSSSSDDKRAS
ncbi:MAG: algL [Panacagrimonas sp.]|nr:mannuronate-specific alginate lyase [Panacagrimonas sp.]MCC2658185.1 algL [Panacagrimonas sp.]